MDPSFNPDTIPWELITAHLQDSLSAEQETQLASWLEASPAHFEILQRLRDAWERGVQADPWYRQADPDAGWQLLLADIQRAGTSRAEGSPLRPEAAASSRETAASVRETTPSRPVRRIHFLRWAAAAILIIAAAVATLVYTSARERSFDSAAATRQIQLPDGSFITLRPNTRIRLGKAFGRQQRLVFLDRGTAYFEVLHNDNNPFTVRTATADIRDLGTRFTVIRQDDSVNVSVLSGRIDFVSNTDGGSRELSAGMAVSLRTADHRFGPVALTGYVGDSSHNQLRFRNETLIRVTAVLQTMSGRPVRLDDPALGQRTLSIHLDGESFDDAIKIICTSLDLDYIVKNDTCIIKSRHE